MDFLKAKGMVPQISQTEKVALDAGTVWIDGDLFSGKVDFKKLLEESYPQLTKEEQAFFDGPVEEVCGMIDEWETITKREMPQEVWQHLKKHKFFCLMIPKNEGGLGFSPLLVSSVLAKLAPVSSYLCVCVLIPNSVGPAELIHMYGTPEQKKHYLPKLAVGDYLPCFGLTEPTAGSDAASLISEGVAFRDAGGEVSIRLNFRKRYITMAPIANLIGLAFNLKDPENLLGKGTNPGITCALIHAETKGVQIGRHHDPIGVPFPNGPIVGENVEVSAKQIIGGPSNAGIGWKMLMEALSGGRAVSLPAQSLGGCMKLARVVGAYAVVRRQFNTSIANFEGIQEPLARLCGYTYMMDAARKFTCGALEKGHRPSVVSALIKLRTTEMVRLAAIDSLDILAGKGICKGPSNPMGVGYQGATIGITVEGANILTRTLIIFGQGAIRCHPYARKEVEALTEGNSSAFMAATLSHLVFFFKNCFYALILSLTRGYIVKAPVQDETARHYQRLKWASVVFAAFSDLALFAIGSNLKKRGKITGRFADILSWMYMGFSTLRRYEAEGRKAADLPIVHWCLEFCFEQMQKSFTGIFRNFNVPVLGFVVKVVCGLWNNINPFSNGPSDKLGEKLAKIITTPGMQRDRLTEGAYLGRDLKDPGRLLDHALELATKVSQVNARIKLARISGRWDKTLQGEALYQKALGDSVISSEELKLIKESDLATAEATKVDDFSNTVWRSSYQLS